jgi:ABC-type Mn2+/Zn2+ transport system permease subunit/Mn-dependent DtxR family transcriptional regulator
MLEVLQNEWAIRALLASMAVGISCGILGCFIVLRNMSMVGDALSHAILPGIVFAFFVFGPDKSWGFFLGAVLAGWLSSFLITWIQTKLSTKNDAAIGIVFTCMFSLGVIGISYLSNNQNIHIDLKDYLFGNVLGVSDDDLYISFAVTLTVITGVVVFYRSLFLTTFQTVVARTMGVKVEQVHYFLMLLLSFAVVSALQTVGVILVVAMLITPASTALLLFKRLQNVIICSAFLGVIIAIGGFFVSYLLNFPPGPSMAVLATLIYILAVIFSPNSGLVIQYIQSKKERDKIRQEDVLKCIQLFRTKGISVSETSIAEKLELSSWQLASILKILEKKRLINKDSLELSQDGKKRAEKLIRAHRLWETYMVDKMGMDSNQIHEEAERIEHHLTDEFLNEVAAHLNHPEKDPHGSPIPKGFVSLSLMKQGERFKLAADQDFKSIVNKLWDLGLMPNSVWKVEQLGKKEILLINPEIGQRRISFDLAKKIEIERI